MRHIRGKYMGIKKIESRLGETNVNHQGCLMKIVQYNGATDIMVEFQDSYQAKVHTQYSNFKRGKVKNPYYPSVYGIGVIGSKYPTCTKEYDAWHNILTRCYDEKVKEKYPTYKNVVCCEEWLLFENFYEWLHGQSNFDKWLTNDEWAVDKDILIKGNKIYSSDTCCLISQNINKLFLKHDLFRGDLPIGVTKCSNRNGFVARCRNTITNERDYIGYYDTPIKAFFAYKKYKEDLIKQVARMEYFNGNITKKCYEAMMNYEVEIAD